MPFEMLVFPLIFTIELRFNIGSAKNSVRNLNNREQYSQNISRSSDLDHHYWLYQYLWRLVRWHGWNTEHVKNYTVLKWYFICQSTVDNFVIFNDQLVDENKLSLLSLVLIDLFDDPLYNGPLLIFLTTLWYCFNRFVWWPFAQWPYIHCMLW